MSAKKLKRIAASQVQATVRGWVTYTDAKGETKKARASQLLITEKDGLRRIGNKRYDTSRYEGVVSAEGNSSLDCADKVAKDLRGTPLEEVYKKASKMLKVSKKELETKYAHLNVGMQRMNLGNRIRAALNQQAAA